MRPFPFLVCIAMVVTLAGCESNEGFSSRMHERLEPTPKVQVFQGDPKVIFEAAQSAMRALDFQISRSGLAQGFVNGHSRLQASDSFGKSRQYVMEVRLHSYDPGKTEVSAVLREQEESTSFAGATDIPIREHGLYGSYFTALEQALKDKAAEGAQTPAETPR